MHNLVSLSSEFSMILDQIDPGSRSDSYFSC